MLSASQRIHVCWVELAGPALATQQRRSERGARQARHGAQDTLARRGKGQRSKRGSSLEAAAAVKRVTRRGRGAGAAGARPARPGSRQPIDGAAPLQGTAAYYTMRRKGQAQGQRGEKRIAELRQARGARLRAPFRSKRPVLTVLQGGKSGWACFGVGRWGRRVAPAAGASHSRRTSPASSLQPPLTPPAPRPSSRRPCSPPH